MNAPDFIEQLKPNEYIVVGTNYEGNHGGGAARYAADHFGLQPGCSEGISGQTYALPTMEGLADMQYAVNRFLLFAKHNPDKVFLLTKVACGIAGHSESDIKVMFKSAPDNVWLPKGW